MTTESKLYMKQHGDEVTGKKIVLLRRDTGGLAPDVAKRLAQELLVRDKVDILGGLVFTPNALAVAEVSAEANVFTVAMLAAVSNLTTKSPYLVRSSYNTPGAGSTHWERGRPSMARKRFIRSRPITVLVGRRKARSSRASQRPAVGSLGQCAFQ